MALSYVMHSQWEVAVDLSTIKRIDYSKYQRPALEDLKKLHGVLKKLSLLKERQEAIFNWDLQARPEQREPEGNWRTWLIMAGRGFGKTRTGAETIRQWVNSGRYKNIALIGNTVEDVINVMIEGPSGILNISPTKERPKFISSKRLLIWPNGAKAYVFSSHAYDKLRGPQFDAAWVDELAKFKYPDATMEQLNFALRLGNEPRIIITTTPKPIQIIKDLVAETTTIITRGNTYDNAKNLSPAFLDYIKGKYENTRIGMQEIHGEIVNDLDGALWTHGQLDKLRVERAPELARIVVAIDPATTSNDTSDETGIVIAGIGFDRRIYIMEDISIRAPPSEWAKRAVNSYKRVKADRVVAEINKGGDLVERMVRSYDETVSFKAVRATRSKVTRAEPVAALYEQGKISHVGRDLKELEHQMCSYIPGVTSKSPDRIDAMVWAVTELMSHTQVTTTAWVV